MIVNALLNTTEKYQFHVSEYEITDTLEKTLALQSDTLSTEKAIEIRYEPQVSKSVMQHASRSKFLSTKNV